MWHTVYTILKGKGEEGQNQKIVCKKNGKKKKQVTGAQAHTRKDRERFFFGFCDFINFFGFLG
jgi:hypothetical protein